MYIDENGDKWWRGNLHTHTTVSDGRMAPEIAIGLYKNAGYDFLALTDHWKLSKGGDFNGMLLLPGIELDTPSPAVWHIVGIGCEEMPRSNRKSSAQQLIDSINDVGGMAILAHPAWSLDMPDEMAALTGLVGVEIYNSVSDYPYSARGYSGNVLDLACMHGMNVPYMAADDTHAYGSEIFRGYIMVKAADCTRESITAAIRRGDFYATQGPRVSAKLTQDSFTVSCSAAHHVRFFSATVWQPDTTQIAENMTRATFKIKPTDRFVRAEVTDNDGLTAWTSAYWCR